MSSVHEETELISRVRTEIARVLDRFVPPEQYSGLGLTSGQVAEIVDDVYRFTFEDLIALTQKDPAAHQRLQLVFEAYKSIQAVMQYRIASTIYCAPALDEEVRSLIARKISEGAKTATGIEIHPAATIGHRFVVDHGHGTVIGETTEIGDDCYILQGVVLGATNITGSNRIKRHPTLGNRVEVGGFARILGPIHVGDDVVIAPHCVVRENVPPQTRVVIVNQLQLYSRRDRRTLEVFGAVPDGNGILSIHGQGLAGAEVAILDRDFQPFDQIRVEMVADLENVLTVRLMCEGHGVERSVLHQLRLRIQKNEEVVTLLEARCVEYLIDRLVPPGGMA